MSSYHHHHNLLKHLTALSFTHNRRHQQDPVLDPSPFYAPGAKYLFY